MSKKTAYPSPFSSTAFTGSSPKSAEQHMAKRKSAGLTNQAVADEFGTSKSTAFRKTSPQQPKDTGKAKMMRQGFFKVGPAKPSTSSVD